MHDWLMGRADKRCSANPPGWLVSAIQEDFPAPTGFLKSREQAKSELRVFSTQHKPASTGSGVGEKQEPSESQPVVPSELEMSFEAFWTALNTEEKESFEKQAFDHALPFNQRFYLEKKESGGVLFSTIQRRMLLDYYQESRVGALNAAS